MRRRWTGSAAAALLVLLAAAAVPAQERAQRAHDTTLPIEISADSLEVQQDRQVAVFSGNVDAQQGGLTLRADTLLVHYLEDGGAGTEQSISRIDAEGEVFFSSGTETAEGEEGTYDVDKGLIVLTGSVVLTQGDNVLRGDRVVLDLKSGQSTMDGSATDGSGRVRGLFVPRRDEPR